MRATLTFYVPVYIVDLYMLSDFRYNHCSTFWRAIYVVCTVLVFSYIFFDVLDLDGSDFPRPRAPVERNVVVAELPKDIKHAYLPDRTELWVDHSVLVPAMSGESVHHGSDGMTPKRTSACWSPQRAGALVGPFGARIRASAATWLFGT